MGNAHLSERTARHGSPVIALHCSGANAAQWTHLAAAIPSHTLTAPEHYGSGSAPGWHGRHAFSLLEEAERTLALIDASNAPVHLVGHSYGGGLALRVALERPDRIASLALYEPSAFHLLRAFGFAGTQALLEIEGVARAVAEQVAAGDYRGAVAGFVEYWNGRGAWAALRPTVQDGLTRWVPKAVLEFRALLNDPAPAAAYCGLDIPVLVLRGGLAPEPTRVIADRLPGLLRHCHFAVIADAGHMGPFTHAAQVNALIAAHIAQAEDAPLPLAA